MAPRNFARPTPDIFPLVQLGIVAIRVFRDPAVHDAWGDAASGCARAAKTFTAALDSVSNARDETVAAWHRHGGEARVPS